MEPNQHKITFDFFLISNDHVGNEWTENLYYHDGSQYTVACNGDVFFHDYNSGKSINVRYYIAEMDDGLNDSASGTFTFDEYLDVGETATKYRTVYITEDAGRYSGNKAKWEVTVTVERLS